MERRPLQTQFITSKTDFHLQLTDYQLNAKQHMYEKKELDLELKMVAREMESRCDRDNYFPVHRLEGKRAIRLCYRNKEKNRERPSPCDLSL
ncbi:hypothetical protein J6590_099021 [Homalodisca vitripennis]|nr:hypothetical protein J6590_099021 [Homalodisca vitripennis]